ncbi:hypothetical protein DENSPDRAFT_855693, partial [Dentipellis sp. KUC8613]
MSDDSHSDAITPWDLPRNADTQDILSEITNYMRDMDVTESTAQERTQGGGGKGIATTVKDLIEALSQENDPEEPLSSVVHRLAQSRMVASSGQQSLQNRRPAYRFQRPVRYLSSSSENSQGFDDSPTKRVKPMRNRSPTPSSESGSILARPPSTAESSSEDSGSADSHEKEWMPDVVPWTEEGAARHQRRRERHTQPAIRPIRHDVAAGRYLSGYWTVWSGAARNIDSLAAETWLSFDVVDFYLLHQWYAHSAGAQVR